MLNNKNTINDKTWLDILNGKEQADLNNQEAKEAQRLRDILIEECIEDIQPEDIEITPEKEAQYAKERQRLLDILKEKKLLDSD